jgi:hypothetical protein
MNTDNIKQKLAALKEDYKKTAEAMFHEGVKELFKDHSNLDSFGFKAYSPYFNDGEECTFSALTDYPYINGYDDDGSSMEDRFKPREGDSNIWDKIGYWDYSNGYNNRVWVDGDPVIDAMVKDVKEFLSSFDDDVWQDLIGNHVIVRISKDGIETEHYLDHD